MWRNREFAAFMGMLRTWNETRPLADRVEVRGLDVYSLNRSVEEVLSYLDRVDPMAAIEARRRHGCLTPFLDQPQAYGAAALQNRARLRRPRRRTIGRAPGRAVELRRGRWRGLFRRRTNARVVCAADGYYRAMFHGAVESWNQRDAHMFDTLTRLIERRDGARAVVWAHNSHIGNAGATAMGESGEFNIGQLCRAKYRDDAALIGFSTEGGSVLAADDWGEEPRVKTIYPSLAGSWERVFFEAGRARALTSWRNDPELAGALDLRRLERAIGVIYRPESERVSHYFDAHLSRQFDALVWFAQTSPVTPLPGRPSQGAPDIYPFGL